MKIDSPTPSNLSTLQDGLSRSQPGDAVATAGSSAPGAGAASQGAASGSTGDASVSLSGLSQHLRSLAASGSADIDTTHVDAIKQAIRNGSLKIDSSKIADGVLETARSLLQGKTPPTGG